MCDIRKRSASENDDVVNTKSQCSHLNLLTIFPLKVDAQKVHMSSDFS